VERRECRAGPPGAPRVELATVCPYLYPCPGLCPWHCLCRWLPFRRLRPCALLLNLVEFLLGGIERLLFSSESVRSLASSLSHWVGLRRRLAGRQTSRSAQTKLALVEIQFMIQSIDLLFCLSIFCCNSSAAFWRSDAFAAAWPQERARMPRLCRAPDRPRSRRR